MSERYGREEELRHQAGAEERRSLGPDIDSEGRRMDGPRAGTGTGRFSDLRGENGPKRVGGLREEREPRDEHDRDGALRQRDDDRGTSWPSVIFGWLAALGAGLILSGIVGGIIGAIFGTSGGSAATEGGIAGLVGLLVTLLLAFLIGGYVAGRLASRSGAKHGLLVALLALVVTLVLAVIGGLVGINLISNLSNVTLPGLPNDAPQSLGTLLTVSGLLALLFPFAGGAIGGAWGEKTGRKRP